MLFQLHNPLFPTKKLKNHKSIKWVSLHSAPHQITEISKECSRDIIKWLLNKLIQEIGLLLFC